MRVPDSYDMFEAHMREQEQRQEEVEEEHKIGHCAHCKEPVLDYDDYYDFDGELVLAECVMEYLEKFKGGTRRRRCVSLSQG